MVNLIDLQHRRLECDAFPIVNLVKVIEYLRASIHGLKAVAEDLGFPAEKFLDCHVCVLLDGFLPLELS